VVEAGTLSWLWVPAYAGMTVEVLALILLTIPDPLSPTGMTL
jgi:hypothetical protein